MVKVRTHNRITAGAYAAANMPVNSVAPAITGLTTLGAVLTCAPGTWSQTPTLSYQWRRDGNALAGETAATHTIVAGDQGTNMSCTVKATKNNVEAVATTADTAVPAA